MKKLTLSALLIAAAVVLYGQTSDKVITITFKNAALPAIKGYLFANFPAADADQSGDISNAEALNWFEADVQARANFYTKTSVLWALKNDPSLLPSSLQTAAATVETEKTALENGP